MIKMYISNIRKSRDCQYAKGRLPNEARVELSNYRPCYKPGEGREEETKKEIRQTDRILEIITEMETEEAMWSED